VPAVLGNGDSSLIQACVQDTSDSVKIVPVGAECGTDYSPVL